MFDVAKRCSQRCSTARGTRREARLEKRVVTRQSRDPIYLFQPSDNDSTAENCSGGRKRDPRTPRHAPSDMRAKGEAQKDVTVENPKGDGGVKAAGDAAARSCRGGAGEASFSSLISA